MRISLPEPDTEPAVVFTTKDTCANATGAARNTIIAYACQIVIFILTSASHPTGKLGAKAMKNRLDG
jgi:hypothetical protein